MSILSYRLILNCYQKNFYKLKIDIFLIVVLFLVFFFSYFLQITNSEVMSKFSYLKFHLWFVRAFMTWTLNASIFLFFSGIFIIYLNYQNSLSIKYFFKSFLDKAYLNILGQIVPIIILLFVILIVSLMVFPIIHFRQLIVIYPSLALVGGLFANILFKKNFTKIYFVIFLIIATFINIKFYLKNITYSEQNIEWVIKKTFNKKCKGSNVYFNDDGRKNILNYVNSLVDIYSNNFRPIKPLSELNSNNFQIKKNCDVIIFSFHTYNLEENLKNLNYNNLKLNIKYAPKVINKDTSKAGAIVIVEKN